MSVTITGISILALMSMFNFYNKEMRAINEKLSVLDLEKSLINTLADGSVCTFQLTQSGAWHVATATVPLTFDASKIGSETPPVISLKQILLQGSATSPVLAEVDKPAGLNTNSAVVKSIELANIEGSAAGNVFSAKIKVTMDSEKLVRSLQPIFIHQTLKTTGTGSDKIIIGCAGSNSSGAGGWRCDSPASGGAPGSLSVCVRGTDGTKCVSGGTDWYCQTLGSWPGAGDWQCNFPASGGSAGSLSVCVRGTDGTKCTGVSGGTNWSCQAMGSWPN